MTVQDAVMLEAAPEDVGISSARLRNLSGLAQHHVDAGTIPGAITAVVRRGKLVHFEVCGSMDLEAGKAMRADTIFRIYSMTKPIASVALMTLYEQNRFQLDEPVSRYIPELKGQRVFVGGTPTAPVTREPVREMSIRDVLCHTSGLGADPGTALSEIWRREGGFGIFSTGTLQEEMEKIGRVPLAVDPGTRWIYHMSTDVVARLCEVLSGQSFDRFLQDRIFDPLGMVDTAFYVPAEKMDRFAANYRPRPGGGMELQDAPQGSQFAGNGTYFSAVGGLTSTAADYIRFGRMLANGGELDRARILGPRTIKFMASNHLPGGKDLAEVSEPPAGMPRRLPGTGFGLGFAVLQDAALAQTLGTPGEYYWSGAASTEFFVSPREDLFVLWLTQLMGGPGSPMQFRREIRIATYQALID